MRPARATQAVAIVVLISLLVLSACDSEDKTSQDATGSTPKAGVTVVVATSTHAAAPTDKPAPVATATEEAVAPTSGPVEAPECAAGITAELRGIDTRVDWAIYCPTFLPPNYAKELIGGPDPLEIRIVNSATGARFYFVQTMVVGLSAITSLVRNEGELVGPVSYGDLPAQLFRSLPGAEHGPFVAVLGDGEGVAIQYIEAYGPTEEEITAVAASMRRLDTLP